MATLAQAAFTAGELTPLAYGRTDLTKYATGLRTCKNWIIRPHGCLMNRSGTIYVADTKFGASKRSRLIPFVFSNDVGYVMEFTEGFVRVYGDNLIVPQYAIPYLESDLDSLQFTQSADVLTITCKRVPQVEIRRTSADPVAPTFAVSTPSYNEGPFLTQNADTTITVQASAVTGAITITASAAIFSAAQVGGLFRIEQENISTVKPWEPTKVIALAAANPSAVPEIRRNDGKTYQCTAAAVAVTNTATGTVPPTHDSGAQMDGDGNKIASFADVCGVTWTYLDSGFGIIRITGFTDSTHVTGTVLRRLPAVCVSTTSSLWTFGAWSTAQGYPATCTYFQDRIFFAGTTGQPQGVWASKTGDYYNFGTSTPSEDDDALTFFLNARQINAITDLIAVESLLAVTSSAVWRVTDGVDEVLTPSTLGFKPQNYIGGSTNVRSANVGDSAVYVQTDGRRVRDLLYSFQYDKFTGNELSILAEHLFPVGTTIARLDYAQYPFSLMHAVRDDGVMPTLSYLREQEVLGWSPWDTDGTFEDACSIPSGDRSVTYVIVSRTFGGVAKRIIEKFSSREYTDIQQDAYFVDCAIQMGGYTTSATAQVTLTGGTTWTHGDTITATSSGLPLFAPADVGSQIWIKSGTTVVRLTIIGYTSVTVVTCTPVTTVPVAFRGVVSTNFGHARTSFTAAHLANADVRLLADGLDVDPQTVGAAGQITMSAPALLVIAGLSYDSDLETLDMNVPGAPTVRARTKSIPEVSVTMNQTRGISVGPDFDHLDEIPPREYEDYSSPPDLEDSIRTIPIPTTPSQNGRVCLRQSAPLPVTITGLIPDVEFGE